MASLALGESALDRVRELRARVRGIEDARTVDTHDVLPVLRPLFLSGGLRTGSAYAVEGSLALTMALISGASAGGAWCGVIGLPAFGAEAAAAAGIALERTVLVPDPAEHWVATTAALIDVLPVVVLRPPSRTSAGDASRLLARLRRNGSSLIVLGNWPHCESTLSIEGSRWYGAGSGFGHLSARQVTVRADLRTGRQRRVQLWLPDPANRIRPVSEPAPPTRTPAESVMEQVAS